MAKSKVLRVLGICLAVLLTVLVFATCAAPAPAPAEEKKVPPAVEVVPNSVAPKGAIEYIGSNFVPGGKVNVVFVMDINPGKTEPSENGVAEGAYGLQVDPTGSFRIKTAAAPEPEGVYGVRVYDQDGNVIASSVFLVKKPPAPPAAK